MSRETRPSAYEIKGDSADGSITTSISLEEETGGTKLVKWTPESGVPLSALTVPGWEERYPDLAAGTEPPGHGGTVPGSSSDLFGGQNDGSLGLPGEDGLGSLTTGAAQADELACQGVTIKGGRASAIIILNGRSFLVSEGGALPPRYKVQEVKANGVVLIDTKDESTKWVPLSERGASAPEDVTARPIR